MMSNPSQADISAAKVLVADDDDAVRVSLKLLFRKAGFQCLEAASPAEALNRVREGNIRAVVLDMNYSLDTSGEEGLNVLLKIKVLQPALPVILLTGWGSIDLAVRGMRLGAFSFVTKPWDNEALISSLQAALALYQPQEQVVSRRKELGSHLDFENIIGESQQLVNILQTVGRIASTEVPVLITGESGTGKELIAEAIHANSRRRNLPFVKVNLGGISSSLFESEMFGHRKGAFTDAFCDRAGRFALAQGGTIFLDEIAELDLSCQVKLLRVLQEKTYEVLGESRLRHADVRVICATNRNLRQMIEKNLFREDLFYRINVISLELPPLRERQEDIGLLARHFASQLTRSQKLPPVKLSLEVIRWLKGLPLPGNIRELKNLVERVILISGKECPQLADFADQYQRVPASAHVNPLESPGLLTLEQMEKLMIERALKALDYNIAKVARALGLSRSALYRRLEKFNIPYESES